MNTEHLRSCFQRLLFPIPALIETHGALARQGKKEKEKHDHLYIGKSRDGAIIALSSETDQYLHNPI